VGTIARDGAQTTGKDARLSHLPAFVSHEPIEVRDDDIRNINKRTNNQKYFLALSTEIYILEMCVLILKNESERLTFKERIPS
jgi:hypothetical protein